MAFLTDEQVGNIREKMVTDISVLGKLYRSKKKEYIEQNVEHNEVEDYILQGWGKVRELKTKWKIRKSKTHSKLFEDKIWCQFYDLGYRILNRDETLEIPFSGDNKDKMQIDVLAINGETAFIIECKSAEKSKKAPSYKDYFDALKLRIDGFNKSIKEIYGKDLKIKYIFATNNLRLAEDSEDRKRLDDMNVFYYNNNTYDYIESLIKNYKNAAMYQFLGLIFKNQEINKKRIEIPAIQGKMGKKTYYMFSIEPELLLKIGFILHRTKANNSEMPTYQRLLVPSRLKNITKFIDDGGYFPNSLIVNFSKGKKIQFEADKRGGDTDSRVGILKIPNEYAIAYIIDGQHRLYGYANSKFLSTNTVPVVAMNGLEAIEQLEIFMDINQNQKAVSPSLRLVLEEDLFWNAPRLDSRLKALRSSIVKELSVGNGPLQNKISIGEDKADLTFKPFYTALSNCGLLPKAKINEFVHETREMSLYNTNSHDNDKAMKRCRKDVVSFINLAYEYLEENHEEFFSNEKFIISNRGTYAFIMLLGSLHTFIWENKDINNHSTISERFSLMKNYIEILVQGLINLKKEEKEHYLIMKGAGADTSWFRLYQSIINEKISKYEPNDLIDWNERQDKKLQNKAKEYADNIEKTIKDIVLEQLRELYGNDWELEIVNIQTKCQSLASTENAERRKNGIDKRATWTEMLTILDYKTIIEKYWTVKKEKDINFITFEKRFAIDIGEGFNGKKEQTKWLTYLNDYRKTIAHSGTKESGLNQEEVAMLEKIHNKLFIK